jgi:primase-polymerase (primpol)-like protein
VSAAAPQAERARCEAAIPSLDIPAIAELAKSPHWVLWRYIKRGANPKPTKEPLNMFGELASSTNPRTWTSYAKACEAFRRGVGDGLGFMFGTKECPSGVVGVDLDGCLRGDALEPWAREIVVALNSYAEVSPSANGLHVLARGKLPPGRRKRGPLEMYAEARFFTVTGRPWAGAPTTLEERTVALAYVHARHLGEGHGSTGERSEASATREGDDDMAARLAASDPRVRRLLEERHDALGYPSESEADWVLAACRS